MRPANAETSEVMKPVVLNFSMPGSIAARNLDAEAFARAGVEIVRPGSASAGAEAEFAVGAMLQLLRRVRRWLEVRRGCVLRWCRKASSYARPGSKHRFLCSANNLPNRLPLRLQTG